MITEALDITPLPPEEAIAYLRAKGFQFSWDWAEMYGGDHAGAFTVAKVTKLDILTDILVALDKALAEGTTFETFKKNLVPLLQQKGWWGRADAVNTATGEIRNAQLGSLYRLRTIFNVNVQTSLQVGHYRAMTDPAVLKARPWWRYSAVMDGKTRPQHRQWHNLVLPADSPFWAEHYPPNGWHCRCTVVSVSQRELERDGLKVSGEPTVERYEWTDPQTGRTEMIPVGIDPGWNYNPGAAGNSQLLQVAHDKAAAAPEPLRWAMLNELGGK